MAFDWSVRVYIEDTDFGGIVYYVNYLKFFERARTELLRTSGWSQELLRDSGCLFVVSKLNCDYLAPAKLDDMLSISTSLREVRGAKVCFSQVATRAEETNPLCKADVEVVCVEPSRLRPKRWPKALIDSMQDKIVIERN